MKNPTILFAKYSKRPRPTILRLKAQLGPNSTQKLVAIGSVVLFAVAGTVLYFSGRAATPFASIEPEKGSGLAAINDQSASGGAYVQFGSGTTTPPPSGASRCPAYPALPDASCTGTLPGVARTNHEGNLDVTTDGAVIENMNVNGAIFVQAKGVIIRNVKAKWINTGGNRYPFVAYSPGTLIEDVEIDGQNTSGMGVDGLNFTARRVNIHNTENGFRLFQNTTIEDSYVHDLYVASDVSDPHLSGLGSNAGSNFTIRHNSFDCYRVRGCSGALVLYNQPNMDNVLIEKNYFKGGSYCAYGGGPAGTNIDWLNNRFDRACQGDGSYGPITNRPTDSASSWQGNVWHDTSEPIN
jgi:hypothetical protein